MSTTTPLRVYASRPGQEEILIRELRKVHPASAAVVLAEGFVGVTLEPQDELVEPCVAFSQQCFPLAVMVEGASISQLAAAAWGALAPWLPELQAGFAFHAGCHDYPGSPVRQARVQRLADALLRHSGALKAAMAPSHAVDVPLVQAAQNIVPVAVTSAESVERLRSWASGRCLSADTSGVYQRGTITSGPRRRVNRNPSNN